MLTDEEIIVAVINCNCDELEKTALALEPVSWTQASVFINGILCFLKQQADSEFAVDDSFVQGLKKLRKEIGFKDISLR